MKVAALDGLGLGVACFKGCSGLHRLTIAYEFVCRDEVDFLRFCFRLGRIGLRGLVEVCLLSDVLR
jgi:hypothetical protein